MKIAAEPCQNEKIHRRRCLSCYDSADRIKYTVSIFRLTLFWLVSRWALQEVDGRYHGRGSTKALPEYSCGTGCTNCGRETRFYVPIRLDSEAELYR